MTKISLIAAAASFAFAASAGAAPGGQSSVDFTEGFVCPVITNENVLHSPKGIGRRPHRPSGGTEATPLVGRAAITVP